MADSWQTIEQAAVSLRLSVRTVNRHIAVGKLPSRLSGEGRREVLVSLADTPGGDSIESPFCDLTDPKVGVLTDVPIETPRASAAAAPATSNPSDAKSSTLTSSTNGSSTNSAAQFDAETILALADNAAQKAELAVAAYQALARVADTQVRQVRRGARIAWAAVAVMGFGLAAAAGWGSHWLTKASAQIDFLKDDVANQTRTAKELSDKSETIRAEKLAVEQRLQAELALLRVQAARAEGKLAAFQEQEDQRQTRETLATATVAGSVLAPMQTFDAPARFVGTDGPLATAGEPLDFFSNISNGLPDELSAAAAVESAVVTIEPKREVLAEPAPTPATRPAPLPRKVPAPKPTTRPATTGPTATSDTPSASTILLDGNN